MRRLHFALAAALVLSLAAGGACIADDLMAGIPAPANSSTLGSGPAQGGGQRASYSTSDAPGAVVAAYGTALSGAGWTIAASGSGGGAYGGGGGLQATKGDLYLSLDAGGPAGRTFVHVCVWPSQPKNDHCGD
jgi:hypothetical protein